MQSSATSVEALIRDAHWVPVDLDISHGCLHFSRIDENTIEAATFLDNRLDIDWNAALRIPLNDLPPGVVPPGNPAWLWHTSFCGSTLLARLLHLRPYSVALREPLVLRRLSDASAETRSIAGLIAPIVGLLSRPWQEGGRVVVKPTHAALNIAVQLMDATPGSRALVLVSSLEDFMISHLKKTPETLAKIPALATRAMQASRLPERLPPKAFSPPDLLSTVALQWAAQRELVADIVASAGQERVCVADWRGLQKSPESFVAECSRWLDLSLPQKDLPSQVARLASRHAKLPVRSFDAGTYAAEFDWLRSRHDQDISRALRWSEKNVIPFMRAQPMSAVRTWGQGS